MTSIRFRDPEVRISAALANAQAAVHDPFVTLRELFVLLGEQGLLVFCGVLAAPFLLPVTLPMMSTVLGIPMLLIGFAVMWSRVPWLPARLLEGIHLSMEDGAAALNAPVVPAPDDAAVMHEDRADRNATLVLAGSRLVDRRLHEFVHTNVSNFRLQNSDFRLKSICNQSEICPLKSAIPPSRSSSQ